MLVVGTAEVKNILQSVQAVLTISVLVVTLIVIIVVLFFYYRVRKLMHEVLVKLTVEELSLKYSELSLKATKDRADKILLKAMEKELKKRNQAV